MRTHWTRDIVQVKHHDPLDVRDTSIGHWKPEGDYYLNTWPN